MKNIFILLLLPTAIFAQTPDPVITAFPTLNIPVSARGFGMGTTGIAAATENQQLFYNVAKSAFTQNFHQASVSYMPWLTGISNDTRFMNANYLGNISNSSAMGVSFTYLSLGEMAVRDDNGATLSTHKASEYNIAASYALQLDGKSSLGATFTFIGQNTYITAPKNIYGVCGTISYYGYTELRDPNKKIEWGAVVSNLGPKVSLPENESSTSLPANLGIGVSYSCTDPNSGDHFTATLDANKLIAEDLSAIRLSAGLEYGFTEQFFLRGGVSLENKLKGNRKFGSLGVGYKGVIKDQSWGLDFHYLIPFGMVGAVSPFQNVFGFTLKLSIGNFE